MRREVNLDMYEGNAARRLTEEYREPGYGRRQQAYRGAGRTAGDGRSADRRGAPVYGKSGGQSRVAWKEPMYDGRKPERETGGSRAVWKEPIYDSRTAGNRNGRKASVYAGRKSEREAVGSRMSGKGRKPGRRKQKTVQYKIIRALCFYFLLAGIIATCWMIVSFFLGREEKVHAEEAMQQEEQAALEEGLLEGMSGAEDAAAIEITPEIRQECQNLYDRNAELMILVNKERELPVSYQPVLRSICKRRLEAANVLYDDLCAMLEAGEKAGYQYWIASAHRDRSYQQGLVDEDVEKYMAKGYSYEAALEKTYEYTMPAGYSEHETGLALDILCSTNTIMDESQKWEPGNQWLVQHCHEYGFVLRYPEDKEDITKIGYEPWHFRYVGKEAAAYLTKMGWTLEEFYDVAEGSV